MQRSLLLVKNSIGDKTWKLYQHHLNKFLEFCKIRDCDSLLTVPHEQLQIRLEDYVIYLKKKLSPNTIPIAFAAIKAFFEMNNIVDLNFNKIRRMYPDQVKKTGNKSWSREQIQEMLRCAIKKRTRALVLFLASTGCRIGVVEELKMKHIENLAENCKSVLFYEGTKEEYFGFLTPEASKGLDEYLEERRKDKEHLDLESPVFREGYKLGMVKAKPITKQMAQMLIAECVKRAKIERKKSGKRYDIQIAHGFRKYFNTVLKSHATFNYNIAEKLMGHKNGLDGVYFTATNEQLFAEFKKAIPDLTIDDSERKSVKIQELEEQKSILIKQIPNLVDQAVQRTMKKLQSEGCIVDAKKIKIN